MIIEMDKYRKVSVAGDVETVESRRLFGNTVPKLSIADIQYESRRSAGANLPDDFDGADGRELRVNAYALATQI